MKFDRRPSAILKAWCGLDEEEQAEKKAEEKKAEKKRDKPGEKRAKPPKPDPFDEQLKAFQRNVTMGKWPEVKKFLKELTEDEAKAAYKQLLQGLCSTPSQTLPPPMAMPGVMMYAAPDAPSGRPTVNRFSFDDIFALADAAPFELDDETLGSLGHLVQLALGQGQVVEGLLSSLEAQVKKPDKEAVFGRREAAKLLCASGHARHAGGFLPDLKKATADNDHEALNLLSRHYLALRHEEHKTAHQRYDDADLVPAEAVISLEEKYGEPTHTWLWAIGLGALVLAVAILILRRLVRGTSRDQGAAEPWMPKELTAFSVLWLLRRLERADGLPKNRREELTSTINEIESRYFRNGDHGDPEPDLHQVAETRVRTFPGLRNRLC